MTPERRANIIAGFLIGLAILQLLPVIPVANAMRHEVFDFLKVRIGQDFFEVQR